jgi:hypothetical protein
MLGLFLSLHSNSGLHSLLSPVAWKTWLEAANKRNVWANWKILEKQTVSQVSPRCTEAQCSFLEFDFWVDTRLQQQQRLSL